MTFHYDLSVKVLIQAELRNINIRMDATFAEQQNKGSLSVWARAFVQAEYDTLSIESPGKFPLSSVVFQSLTILGIEITP